MKDKNNQMIGAKRTEASSTKKAPLYVGGKYLTTGNPGCPIEMVISFDTTGSMGLCLGEVRNQAKELIGELLTEVPNLHLCILVHGDYCDSSNYVVKYTPFTRDVDEICQFINTVGTTFGGDWEECYEYVLREVRTKLIWSDNTQRVLVMIGDATPHTEDDEQNTRRINWTEEVEALHDQLNMNVYSVQCCTESGYYHERATDFWTDLAMRSGGCHLQMEQFSTVIMLMRAICFREHCMDHFMNFRKEVSKKQSDMTPELEKILSRLAKPDEGGRLPPLIAQGVTTQSSPNKLALLSKSMKHQYSRKNTLSLKAASSVLLKSKKNKASSILQKKIAGSTLTRPHPTTPIKRQVNSLRKSLSPMKKKRPMSKSEEEEIQEALKAVVPVTTSSRRISKPTAKMALMQAAKLQKTCKPNVFTKSLSGEKDVPLEKKIMPSSKELVKEKKPNIQRKSVASKVMSIRKVTPNKMTADSKPVVIEDVKKKVCVDEYDFRDDDFSDDLRRAPHESPPPKRKRGRPNKVEKSIIKGKPLSTGKALKMSVKNSDKPKKGEQKDNSKLKRPIAKREGDTEKDKVGTIKPGSDKQQNGKISKSTGKKSIVQKIMDKVAPKHGQQKAEIQPSNSRKESTVAKPTSSNLNLGKRRIKKKVIMDL